MKLVTLKATFVFVACVLVAVMVTAAIKWLKHNHQIEMTNTCIDNLRSIDGAKQQWALEKHKGTNAIPTWDDLNPYIINVLIDRNGWSNQTKMLICPAGGAYTIGRVADAPTCSITNHFLPGPREPVPDYSVIPVRPINDETITASLNQPFSRLVGGLFALRPLEGQPSANAWWRVRASRLASIFVYSDQLMPDINSFHAFWANFERQKSEEPLSARGQIAVKETAQRLADYVTSNITLIPLQNSTNANDSGHIHVLYRTVREYPHRRTPQNSSSLIPTAAYARAVVHLLIGEVNHVGQNLFLSEELPIAETNLLATLPLPEAFIRGTWTTIETRKYNYMFGDGTTLSSVRRKSFSESLDEIKAKYLIPMNRLDTNNALAEALQILAVAGVNTNALTHDCSADVKAAMPGGPNAAFFVPCYQVRWSIADTNSSINGSLAAMLEFFEPTRAVESFEIHQPKYILNKPLPALDFLSLLTPENSRDAVLQVIESVK